MRYATDAVSMPLIYAMLRLMPRECVALWRARMLDDYRDGDQ